MHTIIDRKRGSEIYIQASRFNITLEISGRVSPRERRALLLAAFRRIQPLFKLFDFEGAEYEDGWIVHRDGGWENLFRDLNRGIKLRQAVKTRTASQKLGFEIRMRRLRIGLSQEALAKAAEINRPHLSRIERGQCQVKLLTLKRIEECLKRLTESRQLTKSTPAQSSPPRPLARVI